MLHSIMDASFHDIAVNHATTTRFKFRDLFEFIRYCSQTCSCAPIRIAKRASNRAGVALYTPSSIPFKFHFPIQILACCTKPCKTQQCNIQIPSSKCSHHCNSTPIRILNHIIQFLQWIQCLPDILINMDNFLNFILRFCFHIRNKSKATN